MDSQKIGMLIAKLRKEKGLTQKQLADLMNLSDRTISKWERGAGFPDISLLEMLSEIFKVDINKILSGELNVNEKGGDNMKNIKFYICNTCGNIINAMSAADISCCGRKLDALVPQEINAGHNLVVQEVDDEYYITFSHEMKKEHYICFVAVVSFDKVHMVRLYPEQGGEVRLPKMPKAKLYFGCNIHGLFKQETK